MSVGSNGRDHFTETHKQFSLLNTPRLVVLVRCEAARIVDFLGEVRAELVQVEVLKRFCIDSAGKSI